MFKFTGEKPTVEMLHANATALGERANALTQQVCTLLNNSSAQAARGNALSQQGDHEGAVAELTCAAIIAAKAKAIIHERAAVGRAIATFHVGSITDYLGVALCKQGKTPEAANKHRDAATMYQAALRSPGSALKPELKQLILQNLRSCCGSLEQISLQLYADEDYQGTLEISVYVHYLLRAHLPNEVADLQARSHNIELCCEHLLEDATHKDVARNPKNAIKKIDVILKSLTGVVSDDNEVLNDALRYQWQNLRNAAKTKQNASAVQLRKQALLCAEDIEPPEHDLVAWLLFELSCELDVQDECAGLQAITSAAKAINLAELHPNPDRWGVARKLPKLFNYLRKKIIGKHVEIVDLTSDRGKLLNGKVGTVLDKGKPGRIAVDVDGETKSLKPVNITVVHSPMKKT